MTDARSNIRVYLQPAFLICVAVLVIAAGASMKLGVIEKKFLPLKKSFNYLDEENLAPYKVIEKLKIEDQDILKALGTQDYIQWVLEDTEAPASSTVQKFMLFVTYYGLADRVPHVPEECWAGGGFQQLASDSVTLEIKKAGFERKIEGKYIVFGSTKSDFREGSGQIPVLYFFKVNGEYASSRDEARIALNKNLFGKYSYFSKVELVFNQALVAPAKQEAVAAGEKLLAVVLPILEQDHWPDWGKNVSR
jgi:hypothetical protein